MKNIKGWTYTERQEVEPLHSSATLYSQIPNREIRSGPKRRAVLINHIRENREKNKDQYSNLPSKLKKERERK